MSTDARRVRRIGAFVRPPRREICPHLKTVVAGKRVVPPQADGIYRADSVLTCQMRPGTLLEPDYVHDLCLAKSYPPSDCTFYRAAERRQRKPLPDTFYTDVLERQDDGPFGYRRDEV